MKTYNIVYHGITKQYFLVDSIDPNDQRRRSDFASLDALIDNLKPIVHKKNKTNLVLHGLSSEDSDNLKKRLADEHIVYS